uniref:Uncharacterized protein n=1 Tax=Anguilla anguilla TaxID=7936 RepID=A0A0E9TF17_ANGAN
MTALLNIVRVGKSNQHVFFGKMSG